MHILWPRSLLRRCAQPSAMDSKIGSGKISSSLFSTPSKMATATTRARPVDEDVESVNLLNSPLDLRSVGHVEDYGRDAIVRVLQWATSFRIHSSRASSECLF